VILSAECSERGYFAVIGGKTMSSHKPYRVSVTHRGFTSEGRLKISIKGQNMTEENIVSFSGDGDNIVAFQVSMVIFLFLLCLQNLVFTAVEKSRWRL
jgi:hypothetical protein